MQWRKAWRYQRGRLIKSRKSKKDIQCGGEKLGDTKGVIKPRKLRKDRQCNDQMLGDTRGVG
jgi:hypothetical protein